MNEERTTGKNNDIVLIGAGVLGAMVICLLLATVAVAAVWFVRTGSGDTGSTVEPEVERNLAEETITHLSSVEIPVADPPSIAERLIGFDDVPDVVRTEPIQLEQGARDTFWVTKVGTNETRAVEAELVFISEHVYFGLERGSPMNLRMSDA